MSRAGQLQTAARQVASIILGKDDAVRRALCCILARGHLLIEDVPGVGKTTLAMALAKTLGLTMHRIQFTSDLLPTDITGGAIFDRERQSFAFHPGPIFAQVVLADEVNRATPKTQSALLEAMEEGRVSVDGHSHPLPQPFSVIATQNPSHQIGTYPLPESQLDRFLMRIALGHPNRQAEREMLAGPSRRQILETLVPVLDSTQLQEAQHEVGAIHVSEPVLDYLLDLIAASRTRGVGMSPRAGLGLKRAAQAWAYLEGRTMVIPEDIQAVAMEVMAHRLAHASDDGRAWVVELLRTVPVR